MKTLPIETLMSPRRHKFLKSIFFHSFRCFPSEVNEGPKIRTSEKSRLMDGYGGRSGVRPLLLDYPGTDKIQFLA